MTHGWLRDTWLYYKPTYEPKAHMSLRAELLPDSFLIWWFDFMRLFCMHVFVLYENK